MEKVCPEGIGTRVIPAVSYTHLDVYKRQIFGLCNFGSAFSVGAFGLICFRYLMLSGDTMSFVLFRVLFLSLIHIFWLNLVWYM